MSRLLALLPTPESLANNRWLRWAAPMLGRPELWHMQRESVARGAAVGAFFAFILPLGQIPAAVFFTIVLRINLPIAVAATFINTPLTFGPVYYAAHTLGTYLLDLEHATGLGLAGNGSALALGTLVLALSASTAAYLVAHLGWALRARRKLTR